MLKPRPDVRMRICPPEHPEREIEQKTPCRMGKLIQRCLNVPLSVALTWLHALLQCIPVWAVA